MSKNTNTLRIIKDLMDDIDPITKQPLTNLSLTQSREAKRVLKKLYNELLDCEQYENEANKKRKNIQEGKPARWGFRWEEREEQELKKRYKNDESIPELAEYFKRSQSAIAAKLGNLCIISKIDKINYLHFSK